MNLAQILPSDLRRPVATLACLALLTACRPDEPAGSPPVVVTDSAGIRIVEYGADLALDSIPIRLVWRHGDDPGEYQIQRVFPGALDRDGAAIVGDTGNREIVRIEGEHSHTVLARRGQGPTEVMGPRGIIAEADGSVLVDDRPNRKILRFTGDSLSDILGAEGPTLLEMRPVGLAEDGTLLMATASFDSRFEMPWLDGHVARLSLDPPDMDTIASYPMAARSDRESPTAFGYQGWVSGSMAGLIQVRTDRSEVMWRNGRGEVEMIARWSSEPSFLSDPMIEAFKARLRADLIRVNPQLTPAEAQAFADERAASYQFDPTRPLPVMRRTHLGQDGRAWVEEFSADGEPRRISVIDVDGIPSGTVHLPFPIRVLDATRDHLLGVATGEYGVQSVVLFELGAR